MGATTNRSDAAGGAAHRGPARHPAFNGPLAPLTEPGDVILMRTSDGVAVANVPVLLPPRHSPTGYEWGYGGSGPAELARQIAALWGRPDAPALYQALKWEILARMPRAGGTIPKETLDRFFAVH